MEAILACVDFADVESRVVDTAISLASAFSAQLHVLHVVEPDPAFVGYAAGPESVRDQVAVKFREQHRHVEEIAERARRQGIVAHPHTLRGPYTETILREAGRLEVAMIVLGSHGHGRLHAMLVGSVASGVLRGAKVPVLVVPHPEPHRATDPA